MLTMEERVRQTRRASMTAMARSGGRTLPDLPNIGTRKSTREEARISPNIRGRLTESVSHNTKASLWWGDDRGTARRRTPSQRSRRKVRRKRRVTAKMKAEQTLRYVRRASVAPDTSV